MIEWKDIPDYEGLYQASSDGQIRSVDGKITKNARYPVRRWKGRILKGRGDSLKTGRRVNLWKDGVSKEWLVARLVAITFLGKPQEGFTVNHKDGNRLNNNVDNLEWVSLADNIKHGFETGLYSTQKRITVKKGNEIMEFRSLAQFDRFIGRYKGYTSNALSRKKKVADAYGNLYEISVKKNA